MWWSAAELLTPIMSKKRCNGPFSANNKFMRWRAAHQITKLSAHKNALEHQPMLKKNYQMYSELEYALNIEIWRGWMVKNSVFSPHSPACLHLVTGSDRKRTSQSSAAWNEKYLEIASLQTWLLNHCVCTNVEVKMTKTKIWEWKWQFFEQH